MPRQRRARRARTPVLALQAAWSARTGFITTSRGSCLARPARPATSARTRLLPLRRAPRQLTAPGALPSVRIARRDPTARARRARQCSAPKDRTRSKIGLPARRVRRGRTAQTPPRSVVGLRVARLRSLLVGGHFIDGQVDDGVITSTELLFIPKKERLWDSTRCSSASWNLNRRRLQTTATATPLPYIFDTPVYFYTAPTTPSKPSAPV